MIHITELDAFTARFADCALEPLRVVFHLRPGARVVDYSPIHLDGLLARAVVSKATRGKLLADTEDGYWIPLPLKMLWQSDLGFPLWAASVLRPVGPHTKDTYVRHKRNSNGWLHDKKKLVTRNGPWMERRIPTPMQVCDTYEARCIGNPVAIENLLKAFTHIGKLRTARVDRVEVLPADYTDTDIVLDGNTFISPVPANADMFSLYAGNLSWVGWTPPFWKPSLFQMGWRVGVQVNLALLLGQPQPENEVDFFNGWDT